MKKKNSTAYRDCSGKNEIFRRRLGRLKKEIRETMVEDKLPQTLDKVREAIDSLDKELIELLACRQKLVRQAGRLKPKNDVQAVSAPERVAQVIALRRAYAEKAGLSPEVAEAVWRSMIDAFIKLEMETNRVDGGSQHFGHN